MPNTSARRFMSHAMRLWQNVSWTSQNFDYEAMFDKVQALVNTCQLKRIVIKKFNRIFSKCNELSRKIKTK